MSRYDDLADARRTADTREVCMPTSPNPALERTATSGAPRAFARRFFVSRGAAGVVRSTLR